MHLLLLLLAAPLHAQTAAALLARLDGIAWEQSPSASCVTHTPTQIDIYATSQWTHQCADTRAAIVRESFFFALADPPREARLRVDLHPSDESPETTARLLRELRAALTARFGPPTHEPALFEIGFRIPRYRQPVAGDHWQSAGLHYFLHANQTNLAPLGMRRGVQLIVLTDRLFADRAADSRLLSEDFDPVRARLKSRIGTPFTRGTLDDLALLLRETTAAGDARKALDLVAADLLADQLSQSQTDPAPLRRLLAMYHATLGGQTHYGGFDYRHEFLWRAWNQYPQTEGGELAFLDFQRRGWNTGSGEGCPANPDLFRDVIDHAEAFLRDHPRSDFRGEVLYALAQANETWWSTALAPADDEFVGAPPYPRRAANARTADAARQRAIAYYREVVQSTPASPRAAMALRRLPRLILNFDTGHRLFFCSYC